MGFGGGGPNFIKKKIGKQLGKKRENKIGFDCHRQGKKYKIICFEVAGAIPRRGNAFSPFFVCLFVLFSSITSSK